MTRLAAVLAKTSSWSTTIVQRIASPLLVWLATRQCSSISPVSAFQYPEYHRFRPLPRGNPSARVKHHQQPNICAFSAMLTGGYSVRRIHTTLPPTSKLSSSGDTTGSDNYTSNSGPPPPPQQPIVGFHQDEEGDWVASLACGHNQHVRHNPQSTHGRKALGFDRRRSTAIFGVSTAL